MSRNGVSVFSKISIWKALSAATVCLPLLSRQGRDGFPQHQRTTHAPPTREDGWPDARLTCRLRDFRLNFTTFKGRLHAEVSCQQVASCPSLLFPWLIFRQPTGALLLLFFSLIGPASIFLLMLLAKSIVQYIFFWIIPIVYATYAKYHSTWACTAVPLVSIPATFGRLAVTLFQPCRFYKHISHEVVGQIYSSMYPLLNGTNFLCNLCKII